MLNINKVRKDSMDQAITWMCTARRAVVEEWGPNADTRHPELVAALVNAAAADQLFAAVHEAAIQVELLADALPGAGDFAG
ncbi:MAG: hypothetical protein ACKVIH_01615 [Burkholderiales bacterium]|mgnify:CR=1 FL=1